MTTNTFFFSADFKIPKPKDGVLIFDVKGSLTNTTGKFEFIMRTFF